MRQSCKQYEGQHRTTIVSHSIDEDKVTQNDYKLAQQLQKLYSDINQHGGKINEQEDVQEMLNQGNSNSNMHNNWYSP